jgi:hypothetical protein
MRRGLGTTLRLVPAAASLVLLVRTASTGVPEAWRSYLLVLVGLSALYGAILWFFAPDELSGRPFWILGMAAFAVASAVCGAQEAGLAWGLACIFSGGLLFLYSARHRNLLFLPLFGLLGFLALPFTPAWGGMQLYTTLPSKLLIPVFGFTHILLITGYIRHAVRPESMPERSQRWTWLLYSLGLALFPGVQFVLFATYLRSGSASSIQGAGAWLATRDYAGLPLIAWTGGAIALGLAVLTLWAGYRFKGRLRLPSRFPRRWVTFWQELLTLHWFYGILGIVLHISVRLVRQVTAVLEGEGGILWVLVLLALLVALLLRGGPL